MVNKSSRLVWAYESVPGIAEIVSATTTTYEFGLFNEQCKKWTVPFFTNLIQTYYLYSARTPKIIEGERDFPIIRIPFNPTTAQFLAWILKNPATGAPITISTLHTKLTYPITIRLEENEGTVPRLTQGVGCYCISTYVRGATGFRLLVEASFVPEAIEDYRGREMFRDVVSAAATPDITLTSTPLTANQADDWQVWVRDGTDEGKLYEITSHTVHATTPVITLAEAHNIVATNKIILFNKKRPFLTKIPYLAGSDDTYTIKVAFDGTPEVTWDDGGADIAFEECWMAEFTPTQAYETASVSEGKRQDVACYQYSTVPIVLSCEFETGKQWTDYIDREIRELEIKFWKPDMVNYVSCIFSNCHVINCIETGIQNKGNYEARLIIQAESMNATNNFLNENPDNFANHYKAEVV